MDLVFFKSKGFATYILPAICLLDYTVQKQVKLSFLWWHLTITWRTPKNL